jgi:ABC-2 type transport system permease protein
VLNVVQYRADFFFQLVSLSLNLGSALLGLVVIFRQTDELAGWSQNELIALVAVQFMVLGLIGLVIQPSMGQLMQGIRLGTLDFLLMKPADSQVLASVSKVNVASLANLMAGLVVLTLALIRLGDSVSMGEAAVFVVVLLAGTLIIYGFLLMLSTCAFWFVRLDNILVIFETMFGTAGSWPVTMYPQWMRMTLTFIIPVAFAITIPAQTLTGRMNATSVLGTLALAVAFTLVARWFWRFGLKHYTGASA